MVRRAVDAHAVIVAVRPHRVRAEEARLEVERVRRLGSATAACWKPTAFCMKTSLRGEFPNGSGPLRSARATTRREPGSDLLARTDEWTGPSRPIRARTT